MSRETSDESAVSLHPRALAGALVDLVFPPRCQACDDRSREALCPACYAGLRLLRPPRCVVCGHPFPELATVVERCAQCRNTPPAFDFARSVGRYEDDLQKVLAAFKYHGKTRIVSLFGPLLRRCLDDLLAEQGLPLPDALVPVPLHWTRRWRRGFNQSDLLARRAGRETPRLPVWSILRRTRRTRSQTSLRRKQRVENVRGAFALHRSAEVAGKSLVLIDDVMTTGATLNECAKVLRKAGCEHVLALTVARRVQL